MQSEWCIKISCKKKKDLLAHNYFSVIIISSGYHHTVGRTNDLMQCTHFAHYTNILIGTYFTFSRLLHSLTALSLKRSDLTFVCKVLCGDNPLPHAHTNFPMHTYKTWGLFCGVPQINEPDAVREATVANFWIIVIYVCFLYYYQSNWRYVFAQLLFRKNQQEMHLSIFSIY